MLRIAAILALCGYMFFGSSGGGNVAKENRGASQKTPAKALLQASSGDRLLSVLDVPAKDMRHELRAAYRLRPDKRFLLAVAQVRRIVSGQADAESASAEFSEGRWQIRYKGREVGLLPEFPDFSDLTNLLDTWAKKLQQETPLKLVAEGADPTREEIQAHLDRFFVPDLAVALRQVDTLWVSGSRHPALLLAATRALVLMNVQLLDSLETADLLPARALAALAVTKTATGNPCGHEESLLAYTMGYSAHAAAIGRELPESDPARLYVTGEDQQLMACASGNQDAPVEARYLYLLRLAQRRDMEPFMSWLKTSFPRDWVALPLFKAGLEIKKFTSDPVLSEALPRLVLLDLAREVGIMPEMTKMLRKAAATGYSPDELAAIVRTLRTTLSSEEATIVNRFDSGLEMLDGKYAGPFLDAPLYRAYYQGYFFSALYALGLDYLDSLSSFEASDRFALILGHADTGIAGDFQRWYRNIFASKEHKGNPEGLASDLAGLPTFGAPPLMRSLTEQEKHFAFADPAVFDSVKRFASRLDTRTSHRRYLGFTAQTLLLDLKLMEKMFSSAQAADAPRDQSLQAWYAYYAGNNNLLTELLRSSQLRADVKVKTLNYLHDLQGASADVLEGEFRWLIKEYPDNYDLRSQFADYLDRTKKYGEAREVMAEWLESRAATSGPERTLAQTAIASLFCKDACYREGWKAIEPALKNRQGGAMIWAVRLLDAMDRTDDAQKMAKDMVSWFPGYVQGRVLLARLYWRHDKYEDAADVLKTSRLKIGSGDWQSLVAEEFFKVFKDAPQEKVLRAFSALQARNFNHFDLAFLPVSFSKNDQNEPAFAMSSQLHSKGTANLELLISSYRYLKKWKDKDAALAWLKKQIPPSVLEASSTTLLREEEFDLLWDLIPNPTKGERSGSVWLMRAVASARMGAAADPHRRELIGYYERTAGRLYASLSRFFNISSPGYYYHTVGRFLIGMATEEELLALATDADKRCEIAYYLGVRAQGEGRYEDASDWFCVAVETGQVKKVEYQRAYATLYTWRSKGKSLARIAAERL